MSPMTATDFGLTVAFSLVVIINLLGNGAVCFVVLRYRGMRAPINYLLVNLAVSDMMVALAITPQYVIRWTFQHPNGTAGDYRCKFLTGGNFIWIGGAASAFSLVVVAVERYFAIVRPLSDRSRLTNRRLTSVITASWIFALVLNTPLFFMLFFDNRTSHCVERWPNKQLGEAYTVVCFFAYGAIPVAAMAFLYLRVLYKLWKTGIQATVVSEQARVRARLKVTKMVSVVSIMYAVCWLPNLVVYMLSQFEPGNYGYSSYSYIISVVLVGLNSAMNPFIYALHSANFRQHIRGALCCRTYRAVDFLNPYNSANISGIISSGNL